MKILINEILKTFDDNNINISQLNEHGFNEIHFWKFIKQHKDKNKKEYMYLLMEIKNIQKTLYMLARLVKAKKMKKAIT